MTREPDDDGLDATDAAEDTGHYELDLTSTDQDSSDVDALFQDALEAVESAPDVTVIDADEDDSGVIELVADDRPSKAEVIAKLKDTLKERDEIVARLEEEGRVLRERLQRTMADFKNYRTRTEREMEDARRLGGSKVLKDCLEVIDNLERALTSSGKLDELKLGVEMILRQQFDILRRHQVERLESVGQPFDPNLHEAVGREEGGAEITVPTVKSELQSGYLHSGNLLRPAMVTVAMPVNRPSPSNPPPEGTAPAKATPEAGAPASDQDVDFSLDDDELDDVFDSAASGQGSAEASGDETTN